MVASGHPATARHGSSGICVTAGSDGAGYRFGISPATALLLASCLEAILWMVAEARSLLVSV